MNSIQTKWLEDGDIVGIIKTSTWTIKIKLFTNLVPETTTNFIGLAKKWYYDWIIFHRVIKDFMIQTGDPTWTWMGWVSIYWEKFDDEFNKNLKNIPYSVSMANSWPDTNWSQFFINQVNNGHLDNKHSVFWQVVEWKDTVDKIAKTKTWENDKPEKEIKIINIEIKQYENWILKDYEFNLQEELKKLEEEKKVKMEAKKIKIVEKWDIVSVHYTWTIENWEKFDSSLDRWQPIEFEVWAGLMIKGFDEWVLNMKILDKKTLTLSPSEGYWEYDETKKQVIPKTELTSFTDAWIELVKWWVLPTQMWNLKIIETDDTTVTIDLNHELVWKTLIFDIEIVDIR
jgi:cyclophilin family peptidyl-prolyl cis-trans isomerase/FKBP-type peptidyl-prolyl cis-trans isomerase 2